MWEAALAPTGWRSAIVMVLVAVVAVAGGEVRGSMGVARGRAQQQEGAPAAPAPNGPQLEPPQASCSAQLPPDTTLWRNNQTHELYLPLTDERGSNCGGGGTTCSGGTLTWETSADIQTGDVLLVHINDTFLITVHQQHQQQQQQQQQATTEVTAASVPTSTAGTTGNNNTTSGAPTGTSPTISPSTSSSSSSSSSTSSISSSSSSPSTTAGEEGGGHLLAVYSVTGPGHPDSCDVSDGSLLDISPLLLDGVKLVALYDKDLSEGVNLLIIVSSLWGSRCAKLRVNVKSENCGDNEDCSGKGVCYTNASLEGYECQCCPGYIGNHCEEKDACYPSPCLNNGICVDISQGHEGSTFQCLCPYGFTGKVCEDTSDPCESGPCQHGGKCRSSNETAQQFKCECPRGYGGPLCQHTTQDACASAPCNHGICIAQEDGYRCFCQPGFTGNQCQEEYNECESSPCENGGTCTDHIGIYTCFCGRGYTGKRCQVKIDLCDPNPCSHHHYCIDKGNSYSCECPKGFTGPNCLIPTRAACSTNPCRNGGTCWSSVDSFYCACRPGFTGKICNEEIVIEVIPSAEDPIEMSGGDKSIDLQMPVSIHLDHLHNVYVAAGTLACALLIVIVTVVICHCRMHETYKHCCLRSSPLIPYNISRFDAVLKKNRANVFSNLEKDKEPLAQSRPFPSLDSSDVYYALDFSDSQSSPLIQ